MGSVRRGSARVHAFTVLSLLLLLVAATDEAQARNRGLLVGVAGNAFLDEPANAARAVDGLGLNAVRVFVTWRPGDTEVRAGDRRKLAGAAALDARVFVTIYGVPRTRNAPAGPRLREQYAQYAADLAESFPTIRDVVVWNEPNLSLYWAPWVRAAEQYERLLASTYDVLHPLGVRVWGLALVRGARALTFIERAAAEYKRSGRRRPIMDGVAFHPYPLRGSDPPWVQRLGSHIVQGNVARLRRALDRAFRWTAQPRVPILWSEVGYSTARSRFLTALTPELQARRLREAVLLAACQRRVAGILSFQLWDDNGWDTGLFWADRIAKPSVEALRTTIARVRAGRVDCSRFPRSAR